MRTILMTNLHEYLVENNPDLLAALQDDQQVMKYMEDKVDGLGDLPDQLAADDKPPHVIVEICMEHLTEDLRPSKYNYLIAVLEEDFPDAYAMWHECGILKYEVLNLIKACDCVFEYLKFSEENEDDRGLRYAIIGTVQRYLEGVSVEVEDVEKLLASVSKN